MDFVLCVSEVSRTKVCKPFPKMVSLDSMMAHSVFVNQLSCDSENYATSRQQKLHLCNVVMSSLNDI